MKRQRTALVLVLAQAAFLWFGNGSPPIPLIVVAAVIAAMAGVRLRMQPRTQRLAIIGLAFVVAVVSRATLVPPETSLAIFPTRLIRPLGDFFLIWQCLILLVHGSGERLPSYFAFLSLVTIFCAFDQSVYLDTVMFLTLAISLLVVSSTLFANMTAAKRHASNKERRGVGVVVFLTSGIIALAGLMVWARFAEAARAYVPVWAAELVGRSIEKQLYVRHGSLNGITEAQRSNPTSIVLRVKSETKPGYLRGRVFDSYADSRWRLGTERRRRRRGRRRQPLTNIDSMVQPPQDLQVSDSRTSVFQILRTERRPFRRIETSNDPGRGVVFFTPLGMNYLQGTGGSLLVDNEGVVHHGVDPADTYTSYVSISPEPVTLPSDRQQVLLAPPEGLSSEVADLAAQLGDGKRSFAERVEAVESYFQENYGYELDEIEMPDGVEPLSHFLLNPLDAHCEFFASGAVALLRLQNIPTRYVTGYVVSEEDADVSGGWIARNRNAHAWVEAYDAAEERWVIVEATPGMDPIVHEAETAFNEETVADAVGQWISVARSSWADLLSRYTSRYLAPIGVSMIIVGLVVVGIRRRRLEA